MRIEFIREFLTIAEKGSFSLAAVELNITQPALSTHMKAMEKEIGKTLLDRGKGSNGAKLTNAGRIFYDEATEVLNRYDEAVSRTRRAPDESKGRITLLLSPFSRFCNAQAIEAVDAFNKAYPEIEVNLSLGLPQNLTEALDDGTIDCALLVQRVSPDEKRYPTVFLCEEEVGLLVPNDHPLTRLDEITPTDALKYPSVHRAHGNLEMTQRFHRELFREYGAMRFKLRGNPSIDDFLLREIHGDDMVIMPRSFVDSVQFQARADVTMLAFTPPLFGANSVIFSEGNESEAARTFRSFLENRATESL
ncbi:MAG: LysR family transcriptional regulator [Eggerthellaceae bacterium]|nr:LysR family transcriptional regulator [Eggerthellaceae bacterium]